MPRAAGPAPGTAVMKHPMAAAMTAAMKAPSRVGRARAMPRRPRKIPIMTAEIIEAVTTHATPPTWSAAVAEGAQLAVRLSEASFGIAGNRIAGARQSHGRHRGRRLPWRARRAAIGDTSDRRRAIAGGRAGTAISRRRLSPRRRWLWLFTPAWWSRRSSPAARRWSPRRSRRQHAPIMSMLRCANAMSPRKVETPAQAALRLLIYPTWLVTWGPIAPPRGWRVFLEGLGPSLWPNGSAPRKHRRLRTTPHSGTHLPWPALGGFPRCVNSPVLPPRPASSSPLSASAPSAEARSRHGGWGHRHHDRVDTGDVLGGLLILGTIAAIASAASKDTRGATATIVTSRPIATISV